jgi:Ni/Fe-hydrogenase 1 B-type cytochrome subunit
MALTEYRVWDRTQRVFHWVNFLAVLALAAIGTVILNADRLGIPNDPGVIALKTVHVYVGYAFIMNLLGRLVWAFIGGPFARWRALLPGGPMFGRRLVQFVKGFFAGHPPFYLGHNPLARILLSLLVLVLIVQGVTGIVLAGTDVYMPPFGGTMREWVAGATHDPALVRPYASDTVNTQAYADMRAFRAPIVETHELTYFLLLALIVIHIAAAILAEFREGGTIISAMFTGRKIHESDPIDLPERDRSKTARSLVARSSMDEPRGR